MELASSCAVAEDSAVTDVGTSKDYVVVADDYGQIHVLSTGGAHLRTINDQSGAVRAVALVGETVLSGGSDGCLRAWNLVSGFTTISCPYVHDAETSPAPAFTPSLGMSRLSAVSQLPFPFLKKTPIVLLFLIPRVLILLQQHFLVSQSPGRVTEVSVSTISKRDPAYACSQVTLDPLRRSLSTITH